MTKQQVFKRALLWNFGVAGVIAVIGSLIGFLVVGTESVFGALMGSSIAFSFGLLTLLSIQLGGRLPIGGFYGLVLGGWLVKVLLFAILIGTLRGADWIHGPTFFFALVTAVLANLAVDSWVVLKGRIETVST